MLYRPIHYRDPLQHMASALSDIPVHYFAPSVLDERLAAFRDGFPGQVTYAVKANPAETVVEQLWASGIDGFDVASPDEMTLIRRLCPGAGMNYHNPIRSRSEVRMGRDAGVASWSVDCAGELAKLVAADVPRSAEVAVRLKLPVGGALYDFGSKFGCDEGEAVALLRAVAEAGFSPALTFHVGTQCRAPGAWTSYMAAAARISQAAAVPLARLNVGGGFPAARDGTRLDLAPFFAAIRDGLAGFDRPPPLTCEPGRGLVADAFAYAVEVKALRGEAVFLTDGIYGGLSEFVSMTLPRLRVVGTDGALRTGPPEQRTVFGPTCDSLDRLPGLVSLPADLAEGDRLLFDAMGAYLNGVTTRFNGYGDRETVLVAAL